MPEEKLAEEIVVQTILYTILKQLGENDKSEPLMQELKLRIESTQPTSLAYAKSLFTRLSREDRISVFQAIKTPAVRTILNSTFR